MWCGYFVIWRRLGLFRMLMMIGEDEGDVVFFFCLWIMHFRCMHSALPLLICTTRVSHGFELIYVVSSFAKWENLLCEIFCNMWGTCFFFCFSKQSHILCLVIHCSCPFGDKGWLVIVHNTLLCWPNVHKDIVLYVDASCSIYWVFKELSPHQVHYCRIWT
jgi:hypothetical protein